ncbi:MAG: type II toxin-antitoxin system VapC family toxin [Blastochloris sp.]|nr:type II toxin-antitoxin system VapC family toxin [Blastochloris sp.]
MTLVLPDANVLIHALRRGTPQHECCRQWLVETTTRMDEMGLCELVEVALLRITSLPNLGIASMEEVLGFWYEDLWSYPKARRLVATPAHRRCFAGLVRDLKLSGNDINDAWLAALAMEHDATLVSLDRGFARFPELKWHHPGGGQSQGS